MEKNWEKNWQVFIAVGGLDPKVNFVLRIEYSHSSVTDSSK